MGIRRHSYSASAALLAVALASTGVRAETSNIYGIWQHPENGSQIETYPCGGGGLCAKIKKIGDGQTTDQRNPDPTQRNAPIIGLVIIWRAMPTSEGTWTGGIYNRIDGHTYDGLLKLKGPNRLELTGCTAIVICRTVTWTRAR